MTKKVRTRSMLGIVFGLGLWAMGPCISPLQYPPSNTEAYTHWGVAIANGQQEYPTCWTGSDVNLVIMLDRSNVFMTSSERQIQINFVGSLIDELDFRSDGARVAIGVYGTELCDQPTTQPADERYIFEGHAAILGDCTFDGSSTCTLMDNVTDGGNGAMDVATCDGTWISDALERGTTQAIAMQATDPCRDTYLVIVTNGMANNTGDPVADIPTTYAAAENAKANGIRVVSVFLDEDCGFGNNCTDDWDGTTPGADDTGRPLAQAIAENVNGGAFIEPYSTSGIGYELADSLMNLICMDCNRNAVNDEGEANIEEECIDCNENGVRDPKELECGLTEDCNENGIPDDCDIMDGTSADANSNGIPDECEGGPTPGPCSDVDSDTICDLQDNCVYTPNTDQSDVDDDGVGDVCDNCPEDANEDQEDADHDDVGDVCDNCPEDANEDQADFDEDGFGDVCDNCPEDANEDQADADEDGVGDVCDNCPEDANEDQADLDEDGTGDVCDNCPDDANEEQSDVDEDGVGDVCDNCPEVYNPDQEDSNGDGVGDACSEIEPPNPNPNDNSGQQVPDVGTNQGSGSLGGGAGCGIYNGVGLIALPLTMMLWAGARRRRR